MPKSYRNLPKEKLKAAAINVKFISNVAYQMCQDVHGKN